MKLINITYQHLIVTFDVLSNSWLTFLLICVFNANKSILKNKFPSKLTYSKFLNTVSSSFISPRALSPCSSLSYKESDFNCDLPNMVPAIYCLRRRRPSLVILFMQRSTERCWARRKPLPLDGVSISLKRGKERPHFLRLKCSKEWQDMRASVSILAVSTWVILL